MRIPVGGMDLLEILDPAPGFHADFDGAAVTLSGRFPASGEGPGAVLRLTHALRDPRHVWIPHLAPNPGDVIGDHAFRSPAVILADDRVALALVPDLDDVAAGWKAGWRTWLDYDHPARGIALAAGDYVTRPHVFYQAAPVAYRGQEVRLRLHVLTSSKPGDLANPYGMAARWIWRRWGRRDPGTPLEPLAAHILRWAFSAEGWGETVWQSFEIGGRPCGAPVYLVDAIQHPAVPPARRRWRGQRSIWNQAWFSTQRCANGLLRWARKKGDADLERRARLMTAVALSAPRRDGLFPSVYTTAPKGGTASNLYRDTPGWKRGRWVNSDRRPAEVSEDAVHILDAAVTARRLLEWHGLTGDGEALDYGLSLADRLVRLQRPSGAFPGWVEPDGQVVETLAEGPETAVGASLLLECPPRPGFREAAFRALEYLKGPVAEGRWEDFETYWSCNRWGTPWMLGRKVARNGLYKQNTLSPFWCAEAFLKAGWLDLGRRCLDELSLWQQVWDPPFIPADCFGGFGVMNADGEWNDARQSLFAPLYLAYADATGLAEYRERGLAALRASFHMLYCPENVRVAGQYELRHPLFGPETHGFMMENIAHRGPPVETGAAIGSFTLFTWGNGSALEALASIGAPRSMAAAAPPASPSP